MKHNQVTDCTRGSDSVRHQNVNSRLSLKCIAVLEHDCYDSTNEIIVSVSVFLTDRHRITKSKIKQENSKYKGSNLLSNQQ